MKDTPKAEIKEFSEVCSAFANQTVLTATKEDLEQYLLALGKDRILNETNCARASEMGDTIRLFLTARQSQTLHSQSLATSRVALYIALIALLISAAQTLVSVPAVARALGLD